MSFQDFEWKYVKVIQGELSIYRVTNEAGVSLPPNYIELAKKNNGGRPDKKIFDYENDSLSVKSFLRVDSSDKFDSVEENYNLLKSINKNLFPFAVDSFGNYFCLFQKNPDQEPCVVFMDMEQEKFTELAGNFENFMNKLR